MKCVIPSENVKIISRAIHSLAKIGDEMFIIPSEDNLLFCGINLAESAIVEFTMFSSFFSSYVYDSEEDDCAQCRVTMKSCMNVFKSIHCMDKQVESCEIKFKKNGNTLIFQIKFTNSSIKKHFLPIIEGNIDQASHIKDESNIITITAKSLASSLKNFRQSEDEVTLTIDKEKMQLKNHLELTRDTNMMRTEVCFEPSEFEWYKVDSPTIITFCLKELRAAVMFAEPANLPITMAFNKPGTPIVIQVMNYQAYEAKFVLSTLDKRDLLGRSIRSSSSTISSQSRSQVSGVVPLSDIAKRKRKSVKRVNDPFVFPSEETDGMRGSFLTPSVQSGSVDIPIVAPLSDNCTQDVEVIALELCAPNESTSESFLNNSVNNRPAEEPHNNSHPVQEPYVEVSPSVVDEDENSREALPSHVSNLINTVFARCFKGSNSVKVIPGHDIVLSQESEMGSILDRDQSHASNKKQRII